MAQPSLALEILQENDNLSGREREKAEEVIASALGSMYAGECTYQWPRRES